MSRGYQELKVDGAAVASAMRTAQSVEEYQRYQAIHLRVNEGLGVEEIARMTGLAESTIHNLHSRCRREGLDAAKARDKGGRYRSYLSEEEELELLKALEPEARRGGMLEVSKVHRAFEEKVGGEVALFTTYRMLHRHGWRKIAPRPQHPKADKEAQEAFKKTGRPSSQKPRNKPTQ
jgi:transposase